ncbi:MAG TPA: translation elongation factor Ts, partial [Puia sp.]|nr:translation elongation factor Ts [Puia sp.]
TADHKTGFIITLACETDFVAKNADFVTFAKHIMDAAIKSNVNSLDELLSVKLEGVSVADKINDQVAKIGEKIQLTRFERVDADAVAAYIHGAHRMGVLVGLSKNNSEVLEAGKDLAMQIAAMNPVAVDADSVSPETVEREKSIVTEQIKNDPKMAGKPNEMIEKIALGKLSAFFKENTLLAQPFVKDQSKTVGDYLKSVDNSVKVTQFKRVQLG